MASDTGTGAATARRPPGPRLHSHGCRERHADPGDQATGLGGQLLTGGDVRAILGNAGFTAFEDALESTHDRVHTWVGGTMRVIDTAPADPLFWMHHANVDRIWTSGQKSHPGQNPSLSGSSPVLDPWSQTEAETRDIAALGYSYDRLP